MNGNPTIPQVNQEGIPPAYQIAYSKMATDLKFLGVLKIVVGAIYCLTIFGVLIGVLDIIQGIRLRNAGESFRYYLHSNDGIHLNAALEQLSRFFSSEKSVKIIILALFALYLVIVIIMVIYKG